jgi:succinate dehydrogenase / fumarate reductase cytochrome b subunit
MSTLVLTVREALRYRGNEGQLAWVGHRLAGLGTLLFFVIHILDTALVTFKPEWYVFAIDIYKLPPFQVGEMLLMLAVIYHGVNGLRIILMDTYPHLWQRQRQRQMTLGVFGLTALLYLPALYVMLHDALKFIYGIQLPWFN